MKVSKLTTVTTKLMFLERGMYAASAEAEKVLMEAAALLMEEAAERRKARAAALFTVVPPMVMAEAA